MCVDILILVNSFTKEVKVSPQNTLCPKRPLDENASWIVSLFLSKTIQKVQGIGMDYLWLAVKRQQEI